MSTWEVREMAKTDPIRTMDDINKIKTYFLEKNRIRDYVLFTFGINTALRIGDVLHLTWEDVFDFQNMQFLNHLMTTEQKTQKKTTIKLNDQVYQALLLLKEKSDPVKPGDYIFQSQRYGNHPIHRTRAYTIIRDAAKAVKLEGVISCHSLRKTFGYHAWKNGFPPALIMDIYNHSSIEITRRYLSINQDDKDFLFSKLLL